MNVESRLEAPGGHADIWQGQDMRRALAVRDLGTVFRLLQKQGVSQRVIAGSTGMSTSEVYEVLRGRRVMAYDVLCRVADGFGIERGYLGLAFDDETAQFLDQPQPGSTDERDDGRALLAYAASVAVGTAEALTTMRSGRRPVIGPLPVRVGADDVVQLEAVTAGLRELDYRFGGGVCCEAVLAHARRAERLAALPAEPDVAGRLLVAVADVANLAGWTAFDVGLYAAARDHLARALDRARQAAVPSLTANVLYRAGRVHLHRGMTQEALRFFQLGQLAAQDSGSHRTVAMLWANIAWAYAELGDEEQADVHLGRAADEFTRGGDDGSTEPWAQFFGEADIAALSGVTQLALATRIPARAAPARAALERSVADRGPEMARSLAFEQGELARACLIQRDAEATMIVGEEALVQAQRLRSRRVLDRLRPLAELAGAHPERGPAADAVRDLGRRIAVAVREPGGTE
jgi:transcriptional regulator with XRE-family HTH domain